MLLLKDWSVSQIEFISLPTRDSSKTQVAKELN